MDGLAGADEAVCRLADGRGRLSAREKNRAWADRFFEQADRIARRGDLESFVGRGLVMLMRSLATVSPSLCERVKLWEQLCAASSDGTLREVAGELQWQLEYMEGGSTDVGGSEDRL